MNALSSQGSSTSSGILQGWWPNPIFRRFCRSRLRPQSLTVWLLLTAVVASAAFFIPRTLTMYHGRMDVADAERTAVFPVMIVQIIILFIFGTGNVAAGVTAEADEGTLDYQRLSPLTPLRKVLGYLFGLPIREWCMFALTLPFTAWTLWKGQIEARHWVPVYAALISSAILYHFTGLVAGTVVKNRRWAFLFSIILVILLYTVIPQAAKFGLVYFKYLTIWPVIDDHYLGFMPRDIRGPMHFVESLQDAPKVRFFGLNFSEVTFTIFSQSVLSLTFGMILWRRWRRAESHMLGKIWAVGLFIWMQLVLLGNALPLVDSGALFLGRLISKGLSGFGMPMIDPRIEDALLMIGLYGLVTLGLMVVLILIITPAVDDQLRGLRRARKLGQSRVPLAADAASSLVFVVVMAVAGGSGWTVFARELVGSHWFTGHHLSAHTGPLLVGVLLASGLICQAIIEAWNSRAFLLVGIFAGLLPLLVGLVIGLVGKSMLTPAVWIAGLSPVSAPLYAAGSLVETSGLPLEVSRAIPRAFWFWQGITAITAVWLLMKLKAFHKARRESVLGTEAVIVASVEKS